MTRTLAILIVCVIAPFAAAAQDQAQNHSAAVAEVRTAIEMGEFQEAVRLAEQAERQLGVSQRDERFALLMLKGDALQRAGSFAYAADAYNDAMHLASGRQQRALARASAVLARHAATGGAELARAELPAGARGGVDKEPMRRMYERIRQTVEPKVKEAVEGTTLPPMYELLPSLADLASLELAADQSLDKTLPLLQQLGDRAGELIGAELRRLESELTGIQRGAGQVQYITGRGFAARRGLQTNEREVLEQMVPYLNRIEAVTRDGRRIAELLEAPKAVEAWEDLGVRASDLAAQVQSVLTRRY